MTIFHRKFLIPCNFFIFYQEQSSLFYAIANEIQMCFTQQLQRNCQNLLQHIESHYGKI